MKALDFKSQLIRASVMALVLQSIAPPALAATAVTPITTLKYEALAQIERNAQRANYLSSGRAAYQVEGVAALQLENNQGAQLAGVSAQQTARVVEQMPANVPLVLGRYNPMTGTLAVEVFKVERLGVTTGVYRAVFTPAHGELWARARTYMDPALKRIGQGSGVNPFARFTGTNPELFANTSFAAAQVVLGHAMRFVSAPVGVLSVANARTEQTRTVTGSALRKNITVTTTGRVAPQWYVAAPPVLQGGGSSAAICVDPADDCSLRPYLIAPAMMTFQQWQGGTMPQTEELLTSMSEPQSGFTVTSFIAAASVAELTMGGALSALRPALSGQGAAANLVAGLQQHGGSEGAYAMNPATSTEESLYAGLQTVLEGGSLEAVQESYRGKVEDGRAPLSDSADSFGQEFSQLSQSRVITADPLVDGLTSVRSFYVGDCTANKTLAQCADAAASGIVPRADTYVEFDATRFYQDTPR